MPELPLVSIITPVYQMASYVHEAIESVFAQDYPRIEYIVMDAGSTDGTREILRRYEQNSSRMNRHVTFRWFSEQDAGAADAINKGFERSHGSVFAYLNADDTYKPGALSAAVHALLDDPTIDGVYGEANWVGADGGIIGRYPTREFDPRLLSSECFICQPASFVRREIFAAVGMLDPSLGYAFDYEFWIRIAKTHRLGKIDDLLATSRMHRSNKTFKDRRKVLREAIEILRRHYGYAPFSRVLAYTAHVIDGRDQFFLPFRPSVTKYLMALPAGWRFNWKHPLRYAQEWASVSNVDAMLRHVSWRRFLDAEN